MSPEIKYGLRLKKTGKLLGFSVSSNEGAEFCGDNTYELEEIFEMKYAKEPDHMLYLRKQMEEHPELHYSWHDWLGIIKGWR